MVVKGLKEMQKSLVALIARLVFDAFDTHRFLTHYVNDVYKYMLTHSTPASPFWQ
jgi:hypothetical protein